MRNFVLVAIVVIAGGGDSLVLESPPVTKGTRSVPVMLSFVVSRNGGKHENLVGYNGGLFTVFVIVNHCA